MDQLRRRQRTARTVEAGRRGGGRGRGRSYPHYVRPLADDADIRIVAAMNYYTDSYPESTRPRELNRHLYGDQ